MTDVNIERAVRRRPPQVRLGNRILTPRPSIPDDAEPVSVEVIRRLYDEAKAEVEAERLSALARRLFLAIRMMPTGVSRTTLYRFGHPTDIDRTLSVMKSLGWVSTAEEGWGNRAEQYVYPGNVWREDAVDTRTPPEVFLHTSPATLRLPESTPFRPADLFEEGGAE